MLFVNLENEARKATRQLQEAHPNLTFYHILGGMNKMMALCP